MSQLIRPSVRSAAVLLSSATFSMVAAAQSANRSGSQHDTAFNVSRTGVIDITTTRNDLIVRGTDRPNAELRARARTYKLQSSGVAVSLTVGDDDRRSKARGRDDDDDLVQLFVPHGVRLVIHSTSGDVDIADVSGDIDVHAHSGDIHTRALGGRAIIETLSGDIEMDGGVGDLRVSTVSGDLTARRVRGTIDVSTTSGTIVLNTERTSRVQVDATSGDITLSGVMNSDARVQLVTHSGDIALRLPESFGGIMEVTTVTGEFEAAGMTMLPSGGTLSIGGVAGPERSLSGNDRTRARASVTGNPNNTKRFEFGGGGSARISVSTFNGDVAVQRVRRGNEEEQQ